MWLKFGYIEIIREQRFCYPYKNMLVTFIFPGKVAMFSTHPTYFFLFLVKTYPLLCATYWNQEPKWFRCPEWIDEDGSWQRHLLQPTSGRRKWVEGSAQAVALFPLSHLPTWVYKERRGNATCHMKQKIKKNPKICNAEI